MLAPAISARGAAVEPERFVPVKPEIQVTVGQHNHDPRAQRTYTEELRREPITEKYVPNCCFSYNVSLHTLTVIHWHNHSYKHSFPPLNTALQSVGTIPVSPLNISNRRQKYLLWCNSWCLHPVVLLIAV